MQDKGFNLSSESHFYGSYGLIVASKTRANWMNHVTPFLTNEVHFCYRSVSTLYRGRKIENNDVSFEDNFISIKYTIQFSLAMHYKKSLTSKWWQIDTYVTVIDLKFKCIWVTLMLFRCVLSINTVLQNKHVVRIIFYDIQNISSTSNRGPSAKSH